MEATTRQVALSVSTASKYLLFLPALAVCLWQTPANAEPTATEEPLTEKPEVITVVGKASMLYLRETQKKMFELYNALNSDNDNDVHCGFDTALGTKMKHWDCDIIFLQKEQQRDMAEYIFEAQATARPETPWWANPNVKFPRKKAQIRFDMKERVAQMEAEFRELAQSHTELGKLFADYSATKKKLEAKGE